MATEDRLIYANAESCSETTKIKTHHARIVVDGTADKPYYSIEWYDPTKKEYYLGYSSYFIGNVFTWLLEHFEIIEAPTVDAVEVVRCKDCKNDGRCSIQDAMNWTPRTEITDAFCSYGERKDNDNL